MITDKIQELEKLRAATKALEIEVEQETTKALADLPAQYGFSTLAGFIKALKVAARKGPKRKAAKAAGGNRRTRTKITPELRAQVIEAAKAKKTGAAIAKEFGISLPSVQNIKKAAGLVTARK